MTGAEKQAAQNLLQSLGLNPVSNGVAVATGAGVPVNMITGQTPVSGTKVPKGTSIVLEYNYVPSERFPHMVWVRARSGISVRDFITPPS